MDLVHGGPSYSGPSYISLAARSGSRLRRRFPGSRVPFPSVSAPRARTCPATNAVVTGQMVVLLVAEPSPEERHCRSRRRGREGHAAAHGKAPSGGTAPGGSTPDAASGRRRQLSTPTRLRRLLVAMITATVLFWIAATILQQGCRPLLIRPITPCLPRIRMRSRRGRSCRMPIWRRGRRSGRARPS